MGRRALIGVILAAAAAAVVLISVLPSADRGGSGPGEGAGPGAPASPEGSPPGAAVAAWGAVGQAVDLMIRADENVHLEGLMTLEEGPDNQGQMQRDGGPARVHYVWCEDAGQPEIEPTAGEGALGYDEHLAVFEFSVPRGGVYYPWVRVWWEDSCGNSLTVALQRAGQTVGRYVVQDDTTKWWHWLPVTDVTGLALEEGLHTLIVRNREDGARLNRILFTTRAHDVYKPETPEG